MPPPLILEYPDLINLHYNHLLGFHHHRYLGFIHHHHQGVHLQPYQESTCRNSESGENVCPQHHRYPLFPVLFSPQHAFSKFSLGRRGGGSLHQHDPNVLPAARLFFTLLVLILILMLILMVILMLMLMLILDLNIISSWSTFPGPP